MKQHLRVLSFAAATLLFSLSSPQPLLGITISRLVFNLQTQTIPDLTAIEEFKKTLASARAVGDRETELTTLAALGDAYNSLGRYAQAVEFAKASLTLAQELQNPKAKAVAFITLASAYQSLASNKSEYRKAAGAAISGLTTSWQAKDYKSEAKALTILGSTYSLLDENQKAIVFARQGVKIAQENNIPVTAASSLLTLAGIQLEEGEYPQVIEATEDSINYLQQLQDCETQGAALVMLGLAQVGNGNYRKSFEFAEKSLAISQEAKTPLIEAIALIVLGIDYSNSGESQKAIESLNQSRNIAKEQNNSELEGLALEVLGGVYRNSGDKEQAIATYQEAISISGSFSAKAGIARTYQDLNLLATAVVYYKQAINTNKEPISKRVSGLPLWLQKSFPKAIQDLNELQPTEIYRSLANLLLLQKRIVETQQVLELLKEQELREYTGNFTISAQPVHLTLTPIEEQISGEYGSLLKFEHQLNECQQQHCQDLSQLLNQKYVLSQQYYQTLKQLEAQLLSRPTADLAFTNSNAFTLKTEETLTAKPATILIYPLVLKDKLWLIWAAKGGILKTVEVPNVSQSQLDVTVTKFRQLLQNRLSNIDEVQATGKQLYDWLIKPLEGELKANNIHNLVFSLDRSTRYIPMSALFDGEKYLVENFNVSTVVSANLTDIQPPVKDRRVVKMLLPTSQTSEGASQGTSVSLPEPQNPQILAMGVSDAVAGFSPLPNVPAELNAIVRHEVNDTQGIYLGQEFLNKSFNFFTLRDSIPGYELLHIATHSKFVPGYSRKSFLLLGTGEKFAIPDVENWLNLQDIDMVVLSACETALGGTGLDGREIVGIGYYFLKGGAKNVIASLWNVDDQSTRLLMQLLYKNLSKSTIQSPVTKAEALRQAQLVLLSGSDTVSTQQKENNVPTTAKKNSFRHPYYWAPFILIGSGL